MAPLPRFLPTTRADLDARGWDELDIVIVTGDAYVDHPAFGPVLIARFLEGRGFKVGIIAQPDWRSAEPFRALGKPRLFFGVSAGNLDSMLNRLTAQKKNRSEDQYCPGGRTGCRPDRATIVYAKRCREAFPDVPIVLGGIEASLRRIAHYDYWSDTVRRSILLDAKADLLVFGMGERPVWEVADRLHRGERIEQIRDVRGTAFIVNDAEMKRHEADPARMVADGKTVVLPSYEEVVADKRAFALMSRAFQFETNPGNARPLAQRHGQRGVYFNPPAFPLEDGAGSGSGGVAMDELYDLPFTRVPHPMYTERDPRPTRRSSTRSCSCAAASAAAPSARSPSTRGASSRTARPRACCARCARSAAMGDFRGDHHRPRRPDRQHVQDGAARAEEIESKCRRLSCVHPGVCENLRTDHGPLIDLMQKVRKEDGRQARLHRLAASATTWPSARPSTSRSWPRTTSAASSRWRPSTSSPRVLEKMKKPGIESYERFQQMFACASKDAGKEQYVIPYFITGHPGSTLEDMVELALWLKKNGRAAAAGAGLHPHADVDGHAACTTRASTRSRMQPVYTATGLRDEEAAEGAAALLEPRAVAAGARGAARGRPARPDRPRARGPGAGRGRCYGSRSATAI